jgi:hypothetical protein
MEQSNTTCGRDPFADIANTIPQGSLIVSIFSGNVSG